MSGETTTSAPVTSEETTTSAPTTSEETRTGAPATSEETTRSAPVTNRARAACQYATRQQLQQVLEADRVSSGPIVLGEPQCKEHWAMAWTEHTDAAPQPTGYLFAASSQGFWHYVTHGSAIDCTAYGVPADIAVMLRGCGK